MKKEPKPHSFCETPNKKCTMSYCDENGCINRIRELVEPYSLENAKAALREHICKNKEQVYNDLENMREMSNIDQQIAILEARIDENNSIFEMLKIHGNSRSMLPVIYRISELREQLKNLGNNE